MNQTPVKRPVPLGHINVASVISRTNRSPIAYMIGFPSSSIELLVEARRIELLSENSEIQVSPSADTVLNFPRPGAPYPASGFGSFMVPVTPQSLSVPVPHFNDVGCSSSERLSPARGIKPRKRIRYCQLILISLLLTRSEYAARFSYPRRSPSKPVRPLTVCVPAWRGLCHASRHVPRRQRVCRADAYPHIRQAAVS